MARFPRLEEKVRHAQVQILFPRRREPGFAQWTEDRVRLETPWEWAGVPAQSGELFFGYYDKTPWSTDEDKMIFHFRKHAGDPRVEIKVFNRQRQDCLSVGSSQTWNFQQGAMTQWLPGSGNGLIIFNDADRGCFVSRIVRADGARESVIPFPIQALHPNGKEATSLNYRRLWKYRHPYGYSMRAVNFQPDQPLDRDGIWRVDLVSGRGELIVTLAQLRAISPRPTMNSVRTKVNHVMYSPSGGACVFVHRWFRGGEKYHRLYCMNSDGSDLRLISEANLISHYSWRDDEWLIVYGSSESSPMGYHELNTLTGEIRTIGSQTLSTLGDGHPSYSPNRRWIVTDTYPNRRFQQTLILYDVAQDEVLCVGRYLHPARYYRNSRCDLHPRWSPGGGRVSFDSVWTGTRGSFVADVSALTRT